jgi:hypothetical protein
MRPPTGATRRCAGDHEISLKIALQAAKKLAISMLPESP